MPRDRLGFHALWVNVDLVDRERRGIIALKPITLPDKPKIAVNCENCNKDQTIRLELRRPNGRVVPGFSFRNCAPIRRDGLRVPVRWKGKDVKRLAGKEVVVRAELHSARCRYANQESPRLYAIYTA